MLQIFLTPALEKGATAQWQGVWMSHIFLGKPHSEPVLPPQPHEQLEGIVGLWPSLAFHCGQHCFLPISSLLAAFREHSLSQAIQRPHLFK